MRGRFHFDLRVVVIGPVLIVAIGLGFVMFHAAELRRTSLACLVVVALGICLVAVLLVLRDVEIQPFNQSVERTASRLVSAR